MGREFVIINLNTNRPGPLYAALALLVGAIVFGGASRIDVPGSIIVRLVALGAAVWLFWTRQSSGLKINRWPAILIGAGLLLIIIQLIPLPFSIWKSLPGHGRYAALYAALGEAPWLPISLTPDQTLDGLLVSLSAITAYLIGQRLDAGGRSTLLAVALALAVASGLLGLLQITSGSASSLYFYRFTNADASVGFFANANHQASFLCTGIILTGLWQADRLADRERIAYESLSLSAGIVVLLLASIAGTSSRAGILFAIPSILIAIRLLPLERMGFTPRQVRIGFAGLIAFLLLSAGLLFSGVTGLDQFLFDDRNEQRLHLLPILTRIAGDFFPVGSGLGSFDPLYRTYEPLAGLTDAYLNEAHNDYAQLAIEGGLGGILIIVGFWGWYVRQALVAWLIAYDSRRVTRQARAASGIVGIIILHSLVDYPLRTDAIAIYFAFAAAFLTPPFGSARQNRSSTVVDNRERLPNAVPAS